MCKWVIDWKHFCIRNGCLIHILIEKPVPTFLLEKPSGSQGAWGMRDPKCYSVELSIWKSKKVSHLIKASPFLTVYLYSLPLQFTLLLNLCRGRAPLLVLDFILRGLPPSSIWLKVRVLMVAINPCIHEWFLSQDCW